MNGRLVASLVHAPQKGTHAQHGCAPADATSASKTSSGGHASWPALNRPRCRARSPETCAACTAVSSRSEQQESRSQSRQLRVTSVPRQSLRYQTPALHLPEGAHVGVSPFPLVLVSRRARTRVQVCFQAPMLSASLSMPEHAHTGHPALMRAMACRAHLKVRCQPAAAQDSSRVAADACAAARRKHAPATQRICGLMAGHSALVHSRLQQSRSLAQEILKTHVFVELPMQMRGRLGCAQVAQGMSGIVAGHTAAFRSHLQKRSC